MKVSSTGIQAYQSRLIRQEPKAPQSPYMSSAVITRLDYKNGVETCISDLAKELYNKAKTAEATNDD